MKLDDMGCPVDGRVAILDPLAMATLANAQAALFHPGGSISDSNRSGVMSGKQWGLSFVGIDQNLPRFTIRRVRSGFDPAHQRRESDRLQHRY